MTTEATAAPAAAAPAQATVAAPAAAPATTATTAAPAAAPGAAPAAPAPNAAAAPGQAADGKGGDGKEGTTGTEVPEKYDLKAPDGMELEPTAVAEFTAVAKDLKLSNEQAQKLAGIATAMEQRRIEQHVTMVKGWENQSKADKEFGGDALNENLATARKAIETFGSPELKALLDSSGLGNHPEVVRAFFRVGKQISEGKFVASGGRTPAGGAVTDPAQKLYPGMNP